MQGETSCIGREVAVKIYDKDPALEEYGGLFFISDKQTAYSPEAVYREMIFHDVSENKYWAVPYMLRPDNTDIDNPFRGAFMHTLITIRVVRNSDGTFTTYKA